MPNKETLRKNAAQYKQCTKCGKQCASKISVCRKCQNNEYKEYKRYSSHRRQYIPRSHGWFFKNTPKQFRE